jgi:hypothetical protein
MLRTASLVVVLALGASGLHDIPLRWTPTEKTAKVLNQAARAFGTRKVALVPFTDARENRALVGRNTEKQPYREVTTSTDVGAWCTERFAVLLQQAGVPVVAEAPELVIAGRVTAFFVDEGSEYRGLVTLQLQVTDAAGNILWSGLVAGDANHFGRSYKEENYMETLSDSLLSAASAFFSQPELNPAQPR